MTSCVVTSRVMTSRVMTSRLVSSCLVSSRSFFHYFYQMDINDLWIGDLLQIKSTGQVGRFFGTENENAIIEVLGEKLNIDPKDLQEAPENEEVIEEVKNPVPKENQFVKKQGIDLNEIARFKPIIDLHISSLNPNMKRFSAGEILSFQCKACADFLEKAGVYNIDKVTIIHGKGKGVLKNEVEVILNRHHFVSSFQSTIEGGGFEVFLK